MFQRKYRLPYYIRFSHPRAVYSLSFTIKFQKNILTYNRYGFISGKTIDKRATVRNRIKRQIRSCIETFHPKLTTGYDMLFIIKKSAKEKPTTVLSEEIKAIWEKEHLL